MTQTTSASKPTKISSIQSMLQREGGASLGEICAATGWQPHSARAALSGLRKVGHVIDRQAADTSGGEARYCVTAVPEVQA